ncbi:MAG TPA: glycosyltransferase [Terriglobia bacterium]|nr:glycosyltransferase [Terriglobia bacterium]
MNILLLSTYVRGSTSTLVKRGFEQAGHRVIAATPAEVSPGNLPDDWLTCDPRVNVPRLIRECSWPIDLAVLVESTSSSRFFPSGLLEVPVPTAFWAIDNHLNYRWHKEYARQFDVTFFAQKDYVSAARRYGATNVRWLPLAADAEYHRLEPRPRRYGVSFIGSVPAGRRKFFDSIDSGIPLNIMSGVYEEQMAAILAESKIGLNVSIREDLNMRFFEVLASGALLVTQKIRAGMNDLFEEGTHFVTHNLSDVSRVLRYYLEHDSLAAEIARRGRERCLAHHTYRHRCQELIGLLSDPKALERRRNQTRSYRVDIGEALIFDHPTFRMRADARKAYRRAIQKSRCGTCFYLLRYFGSYLRESLRKSFRKTIW